jgi:hypothetical protein
MSRMRVDGATPWAATAPALEQGRAVSSSDSALVRATRDLSRDWRSVFGVSPRRCSGDEPETVLVLGSPALESLGLTRRSLAPEQSVIELRRDRPGGAPAVCVYGGDARGDLYAIYMFSRTVLGIDDFHHWRNVAPGREESVDVFEVTRAPPCFRWRGWFLNDEDLLTAWGPDPSGAGGIALDVWDRVFETLLRCGANFVVPGTFLFPDEPQVRLAGKRGLAIAQHHIEVLGLNTWRWNDDVSYSFVDHPEILIDAWRNAVLGYEDQEMVWSVGYRGRHDRPFWRDDTGSGADTAKTRGAIISEAIAAQVDLIREVRPNDPIVHHLWMEGVSLMRAGHLRLPEGVSLVWPDDGFGLVRDEGTIAPGDGAYYHVAMYNRFANHISEAVPIERIGSELRRMEEARATSYLMVNVSNIRPCLLTAEAVMEFAWRPPSADESSSFMRAWSTRRLDEDEGPRLAELWSRYFAAGFRPTKDRPHRLEDTAYHTFTRMLAAELLGGPAFDFHESRLPELVPDPAVYRPFRETITSRAAAEILARGTGAARSQWVSLVEDVASFTSGLEPDQCGDVELHLGAQARYHDAANAMLEEIAAAFVAFDDGELAACREHIANAADRLLVQQQVLAAAELGPFRGWYAGDLFVNLAFTGRLLNRLVAGGPRTPGSDTADKFEDPDLHVLSLVHDPYQPMKAYHGDRRVPEASERSKT